MPVETEVAYQDQPAFGIRGLEAIEPMSEETLREKINVCLDVFMQSYYNLRGPGGLEGENADELFNSMMQAATEYKHCTEKALELGLDIQLDQEKQKVYELMTPLFGKEA